MYYSFLVTVPLMINFWFNIILESFLIMKKKNYFKILKYLFIFLFCVLAVELCSCSPLLKKAEKLSSNIPFNYPGLRIETRSIRPADINESSPIIICFGDSVTFGWNLKYEYSYPYLLEKQMIKNYPEIKIINSGIGGNTILDGLDRVEKDVLFYEPDFVIVNFGLNDGMLKEKKKYLNDKELDNKEELFYKENGWYYIPRVNISDFKNSYSKLIGVLKSKKINILLLGMNPVTDSFPLAENSDFKEKQKEIYEVYNNSIVSAAASSGVDCINLWEIFLSASEREDFIQEDGIHPSKEGLQLIAESVYKYFSDKELFD
ncbi:MAG: SGNH/GDSL hydrolase family protein [Actinobacteria bacterium]|nr:SGNH/GDSL hydrolase family protein [Actinomycetota bacterium]MBM3713157.1 SGNH/GDSL hydrolase family protein [Actinomycetota bacterium]